MVNTTVVMKAAEGIIAYCDIAKLYLHAGHINIVVITLPLWLLYQGETPKCHSQVRFPDGWDVWHSENYKSNKITIKRHIDMLIMPLSVKRDCS